MYQENKNRDLARVRSILRQQKHLRPYNFSAGDLIFKEGDLTKNLYIVVDGEVDMDVGGVPAVEIKKGDLCGAHALLFESPRNAVNPASGNSEQGGKAANTSKSA